MRNLLTIPAMILIIVGVLIIKPLVPDTFQAHNIGFISSILQVFGDIILGYIIYTIIKGEK